MSSAQSFDSASSVSQRADGVFDWAVPEGWQQGRGAFGGLVVGAMIRAMLAHDADPARPLRSIAASLCAPVASGAATITIATLRRGRGVSYIDARVVQQGAVVAHASGILAASRVTQTTCSYDRGPDLPKWHDTDIEPMGAPRTAVFTQHYEYRPTYVRPFERAAEPRTEGWIRERVPLAHLDAAAIAGRIDAWWPTYFSLHPTPRPMSTIAFTMQLLMDPEELDPTEPLAYRARMPGLADGFFAEHRELWQGDRLVALNPQTFAIVA